MFTQSMPALAQALAGALPEAAVRQLMQSLGNCQQPLTHRGSVNLQPSASTGTGGLARPGTWRPSDYQMLMPNAGQNVFVDMAGGGTTNNINNTHNYEGHQFAFPINQDFTYSNYFGGDTFNVAGDSSFDTTYTNNANTTRLNVDFINNTYVGQDGAAGASGANGGTGNGSDGGGTGGGVIPFLGGGGGQMGIPIPAANQVSTFLKDVTVRGTVGVNEAGAAVVKNTAVDVTNKLVSKTVTATGKITLPTVDGVYVKSFTGSGTASITTVTGGSISGGTASGNIDYTTYPTATCSALTGTVSLPTGGSLTGATASGTMAYDTYPTATCGAITGTVSIPTSGSLSGATASGTISYTAYTAECNGITGVVYRYTGGTFSATPTGIAATGGLGTLAGSITFDLPTGGYLDANCKLVLTTTSVTKTVTFTGAPAATITSQGSVAGDVTLTGNASTPLIIFTPTIFNGAKTLTAAFTGTVSGGAVTLTGTTSTPLSISTPAISMTKNAASASVSLPVTGGVTFSGATSAPVTIGTPTISLNKGSGTAAATLTVSGITFTPTTGSTSASVSMTTATATFGLTNGSQQQDVACTGPLQVNEASSAVLREPAVTITPSPVTKALNLTVGKRSDFIVYLRPRM